MLVLRAVFCELHEVRQSPLTGIGVGRSIGPPGVTNMLAFGNRRRRLAKIIACGKDPTSQCEVIGMSSFANSPKVLKIMLQRSPDMLSFCSPEFGTGKLS